MRRLGFTLVEVLIAIAVAGVLGASLMGLVLGQQRFYGHSDDAILAQQNLRAALDLMGSELRMAGPGDLLVAEADSVAVRFDLVRAVLCRVTGTDNAAIFVFDSVGTANLPASFRGTAYSGAYDSAWVYGDGFTPTWSVSGSAQTTCESKGVPAGHPGSAFRATSGWTTQYGLVPDAGSMIRWYGRLTYRFATSTSSPNGFALWRNSQELVTPFESGAGLQYVMEDGTVQSSVAVGQFPDVRQIRIDVAATGDGINRYGVRRPIVYDIPLRN